MLATLFLIACTPLGVGLQVYKVIKPGTYFSSYEWLTTPKYDIKNKEHVDIVDGVAKGNALPDVRSIADALKAGKDAGFELVMHYDVALNADIPWQVSEIHSTQCTVWRSS